MVFCNEQKYFIPFYFWNEEVQLQLIHRLLKVGLLYAKI